MITDDKVKIKQKKKKRKNEGMYKWRCNDKKMKNFASLTLYFISVDILILTKRQKRRHQIADE